MPSADSRPAKIENPWLRAFVSEPWEEIIVGQVLIRRVENGFELRHVAESGNRDLTPAEARTVANFNAKGEFRPLKSTRDLPGGWIVRANSPEELEMALASFYPNAIADWFAIRNGIKPTDYRPFTQRQTGMYRITTMLDDGGVIQVINRVCDAICLKSRLWTVDTLPPDAIDSKSLIPCLEPCAVFMEAARKEVRALQEKSAAANKAETATGEV